MLLYAHVAKSLDRIVRAGADHHFAVISADVNSDRKEAEARNATARALLEAAAKICDAAAFQGSDELKAEVDSIVRLFEKERYEVVTEAELATIKIAMLNGPSGIASHSEHWYKCRNEHVVSWAALICVHP